MRAKIFIQGLWLKGLDWDAALSEDDEIFWQRYVEAIPMLAELRIPRWLRMNKRGELEAKTCVASLKQISIPRFELCAAVLLTKVAKHLLCQLGVATAPIHFWSDSMVALGYIRRHFSRWTTFVANRVSEVQQTLPDAIWHHVDGTSNPTDCAS
ncbi:uncharacterized protein [Cardiocondyla obscurior]|uniref:uncharacterized protein n=1 Tax=Cardiocondyla obscurior TaxID=286306 RepID=UPI003965714F